MHIHVTQENLNKALTIASRVASGRTPLPILNNVLLRTDQNRLTIAATNLEIAITGHVGGKIDEEGSITVPAKLLQEFVNNLPGGNVQLQSDGNKLHIESAQYKSTINGMAADEFPSLPEVTSVQKLVIPAAKLKRAIQQTVLVASGDNTRPVLTGVYVHSFEGKLHFAATDGYRLAERQLGATTEELQAIVPADTMQEILRILTDDIDEVTFQFDDAQVSIEIGEVHIVSRLIDGTFPDYRQLIPATTDNSAVGAKDEFVRITKIASLFARESGGSVTVSVEELTKKISVNSIASQVGENSSAVDAEVTGEGQVTLNSRYLLEALGCIDEKQVSFAFSGKLSPCILTAATGESDYKHIVMPLKS